MAGGLAACLRAAALSRRQELEADGLAVEIVREAGFEETAALSLLARMDEGARARYFFVSLLRSHPTAIARTRWLERLRKGDERPRSATGRTGVLFLCLGNSVRWRKPSLGSTDTVKSKR